MIDADQGGAAGAQRRRAAGSLASESAARRADLCARRGAVYKALALGYGEPTLAYVDALRDGQLIGGLREAVAGLSDPGGRYAAALDSLADAATACAAEDRGVVLDGLSVEFARLFTGPGRPAVRRYATQYLDRQEGAPSRLNGPATEYATAAYRAEGVAFSGDLRELPDLVTLELEFLYHLTCREEAAWAEGSSDEALNLQRSLGMFLREHAVLWMPEFARAVKTATEGGLYAALADLLAAHMAAETAWLSSRAD